MLTRAFGGCGDIGNIGVLMIGHGGLIKYGYDPKAEVGM